MGGPIQRAPRLDRLRDVDVSGAAQYDLVMRGAAKFVKATPAEVRAALEVPRRASGGAQYSLPGYNASGDFVDSGLSFASGTLNGALTYIQRSDENRIILNGIGGNLVKGGTNVASWSASGLFVGAGGGLAAAPLECRATSGAQWRASFSSGTYTDGTTDVNGYFAISPTGGRVYFGAESYVRGNSGNASIGMTIAPWSSVLSLYDGSAAYSFKAWYMGSVFATMYADSGGSWFYSSGGYVKIGANGEGIYFEGSSAGVGFNGASPSKPVLATGASATVDDVITVLQDFGLVTQT